MPTRRRLVATPVAILGLSVSGHLLGGGEAPHPVALGLVAVLAGVVTALIGVTRRSIGTSRLTLLLATVQVLAHAVFHSVRAGGTVGVHGGHHGPPAAIATAATPASAAPPLLDPNFLATVSPLMLTTHLLATALLAWALGPAVAQVRAMVSRIDVSLPPVEVRLRLPALDPPSRPHPLLGTGSCVALRGPPSFVAVS